MYRYSIGATFQALGAAAVLILLSACSSNSTISSKPASTRATTGLPFRPPQSILDLGGVVGISSRYAHPFVSHYACPAKGPIKYVGDAFNSVINVYSGRFAGQEPCGQIASHQLDEPSGMYVQPSSHDLYVADIADNAVLVFHRGQLEPYNIYTDPSGESANDVTLTKDGTVLASNTFQRNDEEAGSISTWIGGPHGGRFVGNFPMTNDISGAYIAAGKDGTIYFNDTDETTRRGVLWSVSCPRGACGPQTQVAGVSFEVPSGMRVAANGDLIAADLGNQWVETFRLPNPHPMLFKVLSPYAVGINEHDHHLFVASDSWAEEYSYPGGKIVGSVPGDPGGVAVGIAVDP